MLAHSPRIITDGLVLCLDAANRKSYPTTGTTWTDLSGLGNTGTLVNGVGYNGSNGGSLSFDGVNDYVSTAPFDDTTTNRTFSVWYNPLNTVNTYPLNRGRDGAGSAWSCLLGSENVSGGKYRTAVVQNNTLYITYSTSLVTLNRWVCLTGVWTNGGSISLYVNGIFESSVLVPSAPLRTSAEGWIVGCLDTSAFPNQQVAQVSIYNRALSASEIKQNYNALKSRYGLT